MRITLDTHPGYIIEDPTQIEILEGTRDFHVQGMFQPSVRIHLKDNQSKIFHECPRFPYSEEIESGWNDEYVEQCVIKYFEDMDKAQNPTTFIQKTKAAWDSLVNFFVR